MAEVHVFYSGGGAILVGTKYMLYYTLLTLYSTAIECFNEALPWQKCTYLTVDGGRHVAQQQDSITLHIGTDIKMAR